MASPTGSSPTHCCFCGQQCGIQLKVKDEKVVGFEPWEAFPFNKGKLCPKGVKRYMQDEHPDRLLTPLARDEARGFKPIDWDAALDRTAQEIQRHPVGAWPRRVCGAHRRLAHQREGVSDGQVRARRPADRQHRLQRPALHGFGGRRLEKDPRHRSQREPVERHPEGEGDSRRRRQHRRVRPDHHRLPLAGARERREDHRARSADDADRADGGSLHPGPLGRRHRRLQRHAPRDAAARLDRPRFHRLAHDRLGRGRGHRRALHAGVRRDDRRRARVDDRPRRGDVGTGRDELPAARPRDRAPLERRRELHGRHQPGGGDRPHRPRGLRLRDDYRPGQRPGRAGTGPEVRSAPRRARPREPGASRVHRRRLGRRGIDDPAHGVIGGAAARGDPRWPHQGPAPPLLQPGRVAAGRRLHPRSAGPAGVLRGDRLLPVRDGALRGHRAARLPDGGGRRDDHQRRGARDPPPAGRSTRRRGHAKTGEIICDLARRLGAGRQVPLPVAARHLRRAARGLERRRRRLRRHHVGAHRPRDGRLLALPVARSSRARRACTKAGNSATPTARRIFSRPTGGPPRRSPTPTTRSC